MEWCQIVQNINTFWELAGAVIATDLRALPYAARLDALLAHHIGLWDVIAQAERQGSLDSAISNATHNALIDLVQTLPNLRAIAFNGGAAARMGRKQLQSLADKLCFVDLPSSSPAHTIGFERKLQVWRQLSVHVQA